MMSTPTCPASRSLRLLNVQPPPIRLPLCQFHCLHPNPPPILIEWRPIVHSKSSVIGQLLSAPLNGPQLSIPTVESAPLVLPEVAEPTEMVPTTWRDGFPV